MKKITFYKNMRGYDAELGGYYSGEGKYRFGYHFESDEGYLYICPNGLQTALSKVCDGVWRATELSTGVICSPDGRTIKELKEKLAFASITAKRLIENASQYTLDAINALKAYAKIPAAA